MPLTDIQLQNIADMQTREEVAKLQQGQPSNLTDEQVNAIQDEETRNSVQRLREEAGKPKEEEAGKTEGTPKKKSVFARETDPLSEEDLEKIPDENVRERIRRQQSPVQPTQQEVIERMRKLEQDILGMIEGDDHSEAAKLRGLIADHMLDEHELMNAQSAMKQMLEPPVITEMKGRGEFPESSK